MSKKQNQNAPSSNAPPLPPALQRWLTEQPADERRELERTWNLAGRAAQPEPQDADAAWARVEAALESSDHAAAVPSRAADRRPIHRRFRTVRWVVAALLVAAVVGAALLYRLRPITAATSAGELATVTLPDGSRVELNGASSLAYRRSVLGWNRRVKLEGEAFFDVTEGEQPFVVETFNAEVRVLGTRFNVRADAEGVAQETAVVLASGAVQLAAKGAPERSVRLRPGQGSRVASAVPTPPDTADVAKALAWRASGLAFFDEPLGAILEAVEQRFDTEIAVRPARRLRDTLTLSLPDPTSARAVLGDLCAYLDCTYRPTGDGYEVRLPHQ